jgi:hypothetical protein
MVHIMYRTETVYQLSNMHLKIPYTDSDIEGIMANSPFNMHISEYHCIYMYVYIYI